MQTGKRHEKTNAGEVVKVKRFRTTPDDAGGKSVSEKSKSVVGKCGCVCVCVCVCVSGKSFKVG